MIRTCLTVLLAGLLLLTSAAVPAFAQGSARSSLSGVVVDSNGGVVPGATVVIRNNATAVSLQLITNGSGVFSAPALDAGVYTVTVTLSGFKTVLISDVRLVAATPANLSGITLAVGNLVETVEVRAAAELVQTQTATVSSTLTVTQIHSLPLVSQNGSAFIANLPGVDTAASGNSIRASSINGLPQSAINISLDGINNQDNSIKSTDGFWAMIHPKLDQVEEVTVTGAVPGADSSAQGAVTIKWVTRSGTNNYVGSAYEYFRHWALNSNYYFNEINGLPKTQIQLHQFGVREGGPIKKGKAFFFFNEGEFRRPAAATNQRNVLTSAAQSGIFRYGTSGSVDLLALAARNGQTSTADPTIMALLNRIQGVTATTGTVNATSDPNVNRYAFQGKGSRTEHNPTGRIDVNLTDSQRLTGTYNFQSAFQHPDLLNSNDPAFPGFANYADQTSHRNLGSYTLRSTFSSHVVNELVGGFLWSPIDFNGPLGPAQFADQGGLNLVLPTLGGAALTGATITSGMSKRNASHWDINDTLSWLKGNHGIAVGGAFTKVNYWTATQTAVPSLSFGVDTANDPANAMITTTNFPGASTTDLANARALYGLLTGRVTQIGGNLRLDENTGQYVFMGEGRQAGGMKEFGFFLQDAWRVKPNLTANLGLRWEVQKPFTPANSIFSMASLDSFCGVSGVSSGTCNLFKPGTVPGSVTTYGQYKSGTPGYNTDWNNLAPSVGLAWRPQVESGFLRRLLGDPQQATIRGGYAIGYNRDSIGTFTGVFNSNPGVTITQNRNSTTGNLVLAGQTWPVLLRDASRVAPLPACAGTITVFCSQQSPIYPMTASVSNSVNMFDPNFEVAHSNSYTLGFQRSLSKDMALEVRYVGTRNRDQLTSQNLNEVVVVENGFFNEFKKAQANLQANIAAGKGNTFAYTGVAGTSPLPIYLANFTGKGAALASDPSQYTGTNWTNATQVAQVGQILAGTPVTVAAASLQSNATFKANMLAVGLPANFWVMNPDVSSANLTRSIGFTRYDALQIEVRRRQARGFFISGNYTLARRFTFRNDTLRQSLVEIRDTAGVPQAFKVNWGWEIPVGRGRRFGNSMNAVLNAIAGGWEFDGDGRVQSGSLLNFGNVKVVGMTLDDLQNAYHVDIRKDPVTGVSTVYMLPQDIIDNTIRAFNVGATSATGYAGTPPTGRYLAPANDASCLQTVRGDCASRDVFVHGPIFSRWDFTVRKTFPLGGKRTFQIQVDVFNVFNVIGFNAVAQASSNATINQVTTAYQDISNTFDPGGRIGQLMFRLNW
jgi:hypothetical protein